MQTIPLEAADGHLAEIIDKLPPGPLPAWFKAQLRVDFHFCYVNNQGANLKFKVTGRIAQQLSFARLVCVLLALLVTSPVNSAAASLRGDEAD